MIITKPKIAPCCANQNPSLKPPIVMVLRKFTSKIPHPKEIINQKVNNQLIYFKFFLQY